MLITSKDNSKIKEIKKLKEQMNNLNKIIEDGKEVYQLLNGEFKKSTGVNLPPLD